MILWEAHEGEYVDFRVIHEGGEPRYLRAQLVGDLAPLFAGSLGVVLDKGGADEGGNHTTALAASVRQHVAHEVNPGVVEEVSGG